MGDDAGDANVKPAHSVTLPAFQISQYPITNAQFHAFVDVGGYREGRYWTEAEGAGYWRDGKFKGWLDDEPRDRPYDYGSPYNLANHPVVGISWYEAVAFCRWLSEQSGHLVRLPSEAEWEKAARGPDGRAYPWGNDEALAGQANSDEAGITTTCAVGLFPAGVSPYGVHDMSGNVWEWCSTLWNEKAYPFQVSDEWTPAYLQQDKLRVVRGGDVRVASRPRHGPGGGLYGNGFRVVRPTIFRVVCGWQCVTVTALAPKPQRRLAGLRPGRVLLLAFGNGTGRITTRPLPGSDPGLEAAQIFF
jgi:formylglycine-generating enzyme required for sulfatase activity